MSLDLVVPELADRVWEKNDEPAALALQAVARTDTEASDMAWNVLVEALMEGEEEVCIKAGKGLAYYTTGGGDRVDEVFDVYMEALHSPNSNSRKAALEGLNLAAQLCPEVRERKPEFMRRVLMYDSAAELPVPEK